MSAHNKFRGQMSTGQLLGQELSSQQFMWHWGGLKNLFGTNPWCTEEPFMPPY